MVEQMLKFTPSPEERALLDEHAEEIDHLARADRFLFELSKVTHYEQRLRTLHYKKKFTIWLNELRPKIQAVLEASKEVQRSKRLKKILELILAFGNYMNRGQRGNAHGFKLNSLGQRARLQVELFDPDRGHEVELQQEHDSPPLHGGHL